MASDEPDLAVPLHPGPGHVARARLSTALSRALERPLTVLVAPAGTGKTAGLAAWARTAAGPVLWLDARAHPDAAGLAAAWARVDSLSAPGADGRPPVLVVDDVQHLSAEAWAALRRLVERIPEGVRVVLSSREDDPPLPVAALQLAGRLSLLRAGELRFDDEEAVRLVRVHAPAAEGGAVAAVLDAAQGWAALLVLGALALRRGPGDTGASADLVRTDRRTLDYLRDEVLSTLPEATRRVLLCTCDEAACSDELAAVVSGDAEAPRRLRELAVACDGLLVRASRPADPSGQPVWRCHPLLRALLCREVRADGPEHELARAARVAATRHFRLRGQWSEALRHARADEATLVRLLVMHGPEVLDAVACEQAEAAVRSLPGDAYDRAPALLGVVAAERRAAGDWAAATGLAEEAVAAARALVAPPPPDGDDEAAVVAEVRRLSDEGLAQLTDAAALAAWQARLGLRSVGEALRSCRLVLAAYPAVTEQDSRGAAPPTWPLGQVRLGWLVHELASLELWTGDVASAEARTADVLVTAQRLAARRLHAAGLANRALLDLMAGDFQTGASHARECLALAASTGGPAEPVEARALVVLAWAAYWEVELPSAASSLAEVDRRASPSTDPLVAALAELLHACFDAEAGDVPAARSRLATRVPAASPPYLQWITGLVRGQLALVAGDLVDARAHLDAMSASGWHEGTANLLSVMDAMTGNTEAAVTRLEDIVERRVPGVSASAAAVAAADLTRLLLAQGDRARARETLWRALTLAAPQRVIMPLVVGARPQPGLAVLLDEAVTAPQPHPFAAQVERALERSPRSGVDWRELPPGPPPLEHLQQRRPQPSGGREPAPARVVPLADRASEGDPDVALTSREVDVMVELATGGSYSDIARALFITDNTVKTHLSSAYRKLGATSRSAALRAARRRGLL